MGTPADNVLEQYIKDMDIPMSPAAPVIPVNQPTTDVPREEFDVLVKRVIELENSVRHHINFQPIDITTTPNQLPTNVQKEE